MSGLQKRTLFKRLAAGLGSLALVALVAVGFSNLPLRAQLGSVQTWGGTSTGLVNAPVIAIHNVGQLNDLLGVPLRFFPNLSNTGATTLTINLDSGGTLGPINLLKPALAGGLVAMVGSELQSTQVATVFYDGTQFECQTCTANVPAGSLQDFVGLAIPAGWLKADGSAVSRATFSGLFNTLFTTTAATTTNLNTSVSVPSSASYQIGWFIGGANVVCNTTISAIPDGTHITLSANATGSGATTLTIGAYPEGDCSTTFNLPNVTGRTTAGVDGSTNITSTTCTNAGSLGSNCGAQTQTLTASQVPNLSVQVAASGANQFVQGINATSTGNNGTGSAQVPLNGNGFTSTATINGATTTGGGLAHPILMPVSLVYKIIKT